MTPLQQAIAQFKPKGLLTVMGIRLRYTKIGRTEMLSIEMWVPDSFCPNSQVIKVTHTFNADEEVISHYGGKRWLFLKLREVLQHEADEGIWFAGEIYQNPHEGEEQ